MSLNSHIISATMKSSSYCCTALGSSPQPQPVLVSRVSYSVLYLSIPCCPINSSTFALVPVWRHTLCLGDISQCLQTCVVHHQDLPGPLTGGEQPHLRRTLHQLRGKYCVFEVGSTQYGESYRSLQISWLLSQVTSQMKTEDELGSLYYLMKMEIIYRR